MDRRTFLIRGARFGALAATGALAAACDLLGLPVPVPRPTTSVPAPASAASPASSPASLAPPASPALPARGSRTAIAVENLRLGSRGWDVVRRPPRFEGYLDRASIGPGERLALQVRGSGPFEVAWYRLGWYGGAGGRLVRLDREVRPSAGAGASPRSPDPRTGLVEPRWGTALELTVPADWPSGIYLAILGASSDRPAAVPFVVRPPAPGTRTPAPVLLVSAALTWQAYNGWGGKSLYSYNSSGAVTASGTKAAATVSLARPYEQDGGAGYLLRWEYQFVRWQEREGREVEYCADVDLELHPEVLAGRRLIVFAGHHEYWSRPMREALQAAIDGGTNVLFLSANEIYWQVRLEAGPDGPARRITCYKSAARDPVSATQPSLATCRWRERPVNEPEAALVGQMYGHVVRRPADWVVANSGHWLYEGTGLRDGDRLTNLVGQEYDTYFPDLAPAGTVLLARSPVAAIGATPGEPGDLPSPPVQTATIYTAPSGATVFAAGTFQWSWARDDYGERAYHGVPTPLDPRVGQMTRNLFDRLGDGPA